MNDPNEGFNEKTLLREIEEHWGEHGAHADVMRMLLHEAHAAAGARAWAESWKNNPTAVQVLPGIVQMMDGLLGRMEAEATFGINEPLEETWAK